MDEGYLILNATGDNQIQVDLLAHSIASIDPSRPIAVVSMDENFKNSNSNIQVIELDRVGDNVVLHYFKSIVASPFVKTMAFLPDQLLTKFNVGVWESLRGMGPMVIPEKKLSFSGERIWPSAYWKDSVEEKTFGYSSVINAIYVDQTSGSKDIMGLAIDLCSSYEQKEYLTWIKEKSDSDDVLSLPVFPEFMWEQWVVSFLRLILQEKIRTFNFVDCIDLSIQENNYWNPIWSKEPWNRFLTHWVTETGEIKIENFIQLGLIKYQHRGWLSEENIKLIKNGRV